MAAAPGEYHLFRQVQRVVYHCLEVGFGQQDLSSLPDDIRVDQATFTRLCTEIGEHFPQDRLQTQASLEEQILVIQLADDCAESIGLLDADLAADSLPDYLTAASVHAGAIALIQCLLQHQGSAHLGVFMAAKVSNVANLHSGALIRRRLAEHPHFLPVWLGTMDGLALNLPSADQLQTHAHLSAGHRHLLTLLHGLGGVPADDDDDAGILLSGDGRLAMALMHHGVGPILDGLAGKATLPALAAAAKRALAVLDNALVGHNSLDEPLEDADYQEATAPNDEAAANAFGNIDDAYIPPMVWPADPSNADGQGQSYGDFSRSLAASMNASVQGDDAAAQHARELRERMQAVCQRRDPHRIRSILVAGTLSIFFGFVVVPTILHGISSIVRSAGPTRPAGPARPAKRNRRRRGSASSAA